MFWGFFTNKFIGDDFFLSIHPFLYVMNFCFASQYHSVTNKCDLVSNCDRHKKSVSFFKTPLLKLRTNNWKHQNTRAWDTCFWLESFCNCIQNGIRFQITYSFPDYRITICSFFIGWGLEIRTVRRYIPYILFTSFSIFCNICIYNQICQ